MVRHESDLVEPRDEALYAEYKKALGVGERVTHEQAIQMALHAPQPRMWVAFYGVYRILLRIVHGSREAPKNKARLSLEGEIERKYYMLKRQRAFRNASLFFMASFIIAEPSVGFFVSKEYAKRIVWKKRKAHQRAWKKNH